MSGFMNTNDAPSSKLATLYCTVGGLMLRILKQRQMLVLPMYRFLVKPLKAKSQVDWKLK